MSRLPRYWTYLLFSERGETYAGHTSNLRRRLRQHNSAENRGWTRGRRWRVVATECYFDRASAVWIEKRLKRSRAYRRWWLVRSDRRVERVCHQFAVTNPLDP